MATTIRPTADHTSTTPSTHRVRRVLTTLALASGTVALTAEAAHAGIQLNHNESAGRDRRRTRRALATLALAAAVATPVAAATAAPASAAGCSPFVCGSDGNHNESAGRDRRRTRRALATLALTAAVATPVAAPTATPASAAGCSPFVCGDGNHNESASRDHRRRPSHVLLWSALVAAGAAAVPMVEPVLARIALNHNESAAADAR